MKRPSAITSLAAFLALVVAAGFISSQLGASDQTQALILLVSGWLYLGFLGAQAQWERGGNFGLGLVVALLFGPLGLLVAGQLFGRSRVPGVPEPRPASGRYAVREVWRDALTVGPIAKKAARARWAKAK